MWNPSTNVSVVNQIQRVEWFPQPFDILDQIPDLIKSKDSKNCKMLDNTWALPNAPTFFKDYTAICVAYCKTKWRTTKQVHTTKQPHQNNRSSVNPKNLKDLKQNNRIILNN